VLFRSERVLLISSVEKTAEHRGQEKGGAQENN